jgi:hypothetical protein
MLSYLHTCPRCFVLKQQMLEPSYYCLIYPYPTIDILGFYTEWYIGHSFAYSPYLDCTCWCLAKITSYVLADGNFNLCHNKPIRARNLHRMLNLCFEMCMRPFIIHTREWFDCLIRNKRYTARVVRYCTFKINRKFCRSHVQDHDLGRYIIVYGTPSRERFLFCNLSLFVYGKLY